MTLPAAQASATTTTAVPSADPVEDHYSKLIYRMNLTRGARFQAARRHQRRATASIWSIVALSMYVFSTSTYLAIQEPQVLGSMQKSLVIMNIIMSAFIIAFGVMEQGKKHDLKAEIFLRCAQDLQELKDEAELDVKLSRTTGPRLEKFLKRYNDIVHDFRDNHSESDYRTFRANVGKDTGFLSKWYHFRYWFECWSIMIIAMCTPPLVFVGLIFYLA